MIKAILFRGKRKPAPAVGYDPYSGFQLVLDNIVKDARRRIEHEEKFPFNDPVFDSIRPLFEVRRGDLSQSVVVLGGPHTSLTEHLITALAREHRWHLQVLAGTKFVLSDQDFVLQRLKAPTPLADFGNLMMHEPRERKIPHGQSPRQDPYDLCACDSGKRYRKCCGRGRTW